MSLLRSLRNLSVLMIFTVGLLSFVPGPAGAQSSCKPAGTPCTPYGNHAGCCTGWCEGHGTCCQLFRYTPCTSNAQCCFGGCIKININGQVQSRCSGGL
jgi:hypothetical protein